MVHPLRILFTLLVFLLVGCTILLILLFQLLVHIVTMGQLGERTAIRIHGFIFHTFATLSSLLLQPFWRVRIVHKERIPIKLFKSNVLAADLKQPQHQAPILIMANHLSNTDPWILSRVFYPHIAKYVGKADLFKQWFSGWTMQWSGDLPVHFTKEKGGWGVEKGSIAKLMERVTLYQLQYGLPITVFPEGGRSATLKMNDFKPGFFKHAIEHKCNIVPVALCGPEKAWNSKSFWMNYNVEIRVSIGKLIEPSDDMNFEQLMDRTKQAIQQLIDEQS